jgi:hypothetical protein
MMDVKAALDFLNSVLWDKTRQGYREAVGRSNVWFIDNFAAWIVMRKYDPAKADVLQANFYTYDNQFPDGLYGFDRWCILYGDTENFTQSPQWLPDYLRYADLVGLQYLYHYYKQNMDMAKLMYGYLTKMLVSPTNFPGNGSAIFMEDLATRVGYQSLTPELYGWLIAMDKPKPEGHTIYKLALLAMCSMRHKRYDIAKKCVEMIGKFQVGNPASTLYKDGDPVNFPDNPLIEKGGIKTEWWNPDYGPKPPWLQTLANCEATSLCILAQTEYNEGINIWPSVIPWLLIGTIGGSGLGFVTAKKTKKV